MCGQAGIVYGVIDRQPEEQTYLKWVFMHLLLLSERRGPYATGISWLKQDGSHSIFKRPMRAVEFVKEKQFVQVLGEVDDNTTWLAGHTRWPTRGTNVQENAHPIRAGACLGTVNGTILNADILFRRFNLPRFAEVDSEIIFRIADGTLRDGKIDIVALKKWLALCRGQISAVMASKLDPKTIVVVKGNMPLEVRYSRRHRVLAYASEAEFLDEALGEEKGWVEWQVPPMRLIVVSTERLSEPTIKPFRFGESSLKYR